MKYLKKGGSFSVPVQEVVSECEKYFVLKKKNLNLYLNYQKLRSK